MPSLLVAGAVKAIQDHVDDDKDEIPIQDSIGRSQKTPIINESGYFSIDDFCIMKYNIPNKRADS